MTSASLDVELLSFKKQRKKQKLNSPGTVISHYRSVKDGDSVILIELEKAIHFPDFILQKNFIFYQKKST